MAKTCKDCIHYELIKTEASSFCLCSMAFEMSERRKHNPNVECEYFADRSEWVHLPCKVGDTVYCIEFAEEIGIDKGKVYAISYTDTEWFSVRYESGLRYDHPQKAIGKSVFLTREEAEQALKERKV